MPWINLNTCNMLQHMRNILQQSLCILYPEALVKVGDGGLKYGVVRVESFLVEQVHERGDGCRCTLEERVPVRLVHREQLGLYDGTVT